MKTIWHESYFWLYTSHLQAVNFIGCLKKLKFRLFGIHWTQPRKKKEKGGKRKERVNLKERRRTPVKKIWSLREERPCTMSLRNCEWRRWMERWESENIFFFFLLLFLVSVQYAFIGRNSRISPIRLVHSRYSRYFFRYETKGVSVPVCWLVRYILAVPAVTVRN